MTKPHYAPPFDNADYARGFSEGQNHSVPSVETKRRLDELSDAIKVIPQMYTEIQVMNANLKNYLDSVGEVRKEVEGLKKDVNEINLRISVMGVKLAIGGLVAIAVMGAIVNGIFAIIFK